MKLRNTAGRVGNLSGAPAGGWSWRNWIPLFWNHRRRKRFHPLNDSYLFSICFLAGNRGKTCWSRTSRNYAQRQNPTLLSKCCVYSDLCFQNEMSEVLVIGGSHIYATQQKSKAKVGSQMLYIRFCTWKLISFLPDWVIFALWVELTSTHLQSKLPCTSLAEAGLAEASHQWSCSTCHLPSRKWCRRCSLRKPLGFLIRLIFFGISFRITGGYQPSTLLRMDADSVGEHAWSFSPLSIHHWSSTAGGPVVCGTWQVVTRTETHRSKPLKPQDEWMNRFSMNQHLFD